MSGAYADAPWTGGGINSSVAEANDCVAEIEAQNSATARVVLENAAHVERELRRAGGGATSTGRTGASEDVSEVHESGPDLRKEAEVRRTQSKLGTEQSLHFASAGIGTVTW